MFRLFLCHKILIKIIFTIFLILGFSLQINADQNLNYKNFSMQLPVGWICKTETETLSCQSTIGSAKEHSLFVVSINDGSISSYQSLKKYLSKPIQRQGVSGSYISKLYLKRQSDQTLYSWFEALHYGSELKNYFTHYWLSLFEGKVIYIQLSVHKDKYTEVLPFARSIIASISEDDNQISNNGYISYLNTLKQRSFWIVGIVILVIFFLLVYLKRK